MNSLIAVKFLDRSTGPHIFTLIALASISALASNIFLPSLPNLADYYNTTPAVMGLSVGVYLAASAVIQLFAGPMSDAIGRRPVIIGALTIFIVSSIGAIFAPTAGIFLALRAVQAASATAMVLSRAIVRDMVPGEQAGSVIAYVTMGMALVPMVSPMLGGVLDEWFGWQASFWTLGIVGGLILLLVIFDLGETAQSTGNSFSQQFREYPELLRSQRFWGYCFASACGSGAFFAYLGGAPFVGSEVFGLSPDVLGFYFGAPALGYLVGNFLSGRYSVHIGINPMVFWGLVITSLGSVLSLIAIFLGYGSAPSFFGFMTIVGVGNGMTMPNASAGMLSARPKLAGSASGLGGAIMIAGGAFLSAFAGYVLRHGTGEAPLIWLMFTSSTIGIFFALWVIRRERALPN